MWPVSSSFYRTALFTLLIAGCSAHAVRLSFGNKKYEAPIYITNNPSLEEGDPDVGRRTFIVIGCIDCHRVAEDPHLPRGPRAAAGPLLANLKRYSSKELLQILRDSKTGGKDEELYGRKMKDYTQRMSARQQVDVIAYLRNPARPAE